MYDSELDGHNIALAFAQYCRSKGLLSREDVIAIRDRYRLSQRGLALLLGWSPATIARYETGAIPSGAHSEQLRHFGDDAEYARSLFEAGKEGLGSLERSRVEKTFQQIAGLTVPEDYLEEYIVRRHSSGGEQLRGRRQLDLDKVANVMTFFAARLGGVVKSKLLKLMWYADFAAYRRMFRSISGLAYCHNHFGPIPLSHDSIIDYMESKGVVDLTPYDGGVEGECVNALLPLDTTLFTEEELQVLNDVLDRFGGCSAADLSRLTHAEDGYRFTQMKALIPYDYAVDLKAIQ
ncbi:MAG: DUF4065 domain-containing protein [Clostridia bacterium]|nr:DUF4065 domain-containing protein [Clostridia bacterium]